MKQTGVQVRRHDIILKPEKSRVLLRSLVPGEANRIKNIIGRILKMSENEANRVFEEVLKEFRERHRDVAGAFGRRFEEIKQHMPVNYRPSETKRLLFGSYFMCEYSLESAALFNPSIVPHPDQSRLEQGSLRFIMSLRATGEGHISSIEFRTGVITSQGDVKLDSPNRYVTAPEIDKDPLFDLTQFTSMLKDSGRLSAFTEKILHSLPEKFKRTELMENAAKLVKKKKKLTSTESNSIDGLKQFADLNYQFRFQESVPLSERSIFPVSSYESNGIEDARFVRFVDDNGGATYYATYTAYNGRSIMPQYLETKDFLGFRVSSLCGEAAKNKGMALFPRKINGKYVMIARQDGENLYITSSDNVHQWHRPRKILGPVFPWEFVQIGNCGSPLETEHGWLLLTHGVGPVRKYCIGAVLLDLNNPAKVIRRLQAPLLVPNDSEREGYVPNVVYTCGAIIHNRTLIMPYAISDSATCVASVSIDELLQSMHWRS